MWLNNSPLPAELCIEKPVLRDYGFYRRLNDGQFEFISFCEEGAKYWFGIHAVDLQKLLDKYIPEATE